MVSETSLSVIGCVACRAALYALVKSATVALCAFTPLAVKCTVCRNTMNIYLTSTFPRDFDRQEKKRKKRVEIKFHRLTSLDGHHEYITTSHNNFFPLSRTLSGETNVIHTCACILCIASAKAVHSMLILSCPLLARAVP